MRENRARLQCLVDQRQYDQMIQSKLSLDPHKTMLTDHPAVLSMVSAASVTGREKDWTIAEQMRQMTRMTFVMVNVWFSVAAVFASMWYFTSEHVLGHSTVRTVLVYG